MGETFLMDRNFRAYTRALLRHHQLLAAAQEDADQIEVIESRLSVLWEKLDGRQRAQVRGISSDLNWVRRGYQLPPKGRPPGDVPEAERQEFYRLNEARDYVPLLHALRLCAAVVPPFFVAFCRATCYVNLGLPEVSEPFLRAIIDLAPKDSVAFRSAFNMLVHVSPSGAFEVATTVVASAGDYPPVAVAMSVTFVTSFVGFGTAYEAGDLADKLRAADGRIDDEPTPTAERLTFYAMTGAQLCLFGFVDDGAVFLERGLALDPDNPDLACALGEAVYEKDADRAVDLFKRSIQSRSTLVRPYLHLANHYLVEGDFLQAKGYAAHAAERARDDFSLALALEIMAICVTELGQGDAIALALFRRAVSLAPGVKRIAFNLGVFERGTFGKSTAGVWQTAEEKAVRRAREGWRPDSSPSALEFSGR